VIICGAFIAAILAILLSYSCAEFPDLNDLNLLAFFSSQHLMVDFFKG
jgi:hypothetical protein